LSSITKIGQEGYLLAGNSNSNLSGSKKAQNHGGYDFWAIKISKYGDYIWDNTYGGNKDDIIGGYPTVGGVGVIPYFDGFILAGDSRSETDTGTKSSKQFSTDDQRDYWMVKIDSSGEQNFDLSFGGNGDEIFHSIVETPDHGLILGGISNSEQSGNKTEKKKGGFDIWILRLDPVIAPALITEIPDQTMNQGDELILQLEVSGTRPIVVRWFKNDVVLPEYTELQLKISKTQLTDSGVYRAEISNSVGQISSDEIKVKIVGIAPTITYFRAHGIQNVNVYKGEDAIVEVIALGTLPLEYKWFFNGKLLEKHDSKLTINEAGDDDVGVYRVEVSNDYGLTAIKEAAFKFSKRIKPPQTRIKIDPDNRDKVIFEFHAHEKGLWIIESSSDLTIWNEKAGVIVGYKSGTQQAEKLLQLAKQNMRTRGWSIVFNNPTNMGRWIEPLKDRIQFYRLKKLQ
jgi:hypothetical protein